jgi:carboxyl-terminal processing protease
MRWVLSCLLILSAWNPARPGSTVPPLDRRAAQHYAQQITQLIEVVGEKYVRPVSRADLAYGALKGLYEAAQQPLPPRLQIELHNVADSAFDFHQLLARHRAGLGNPDALQGIGAVRASLKGMMQALDPYCAVLSREELPSADIVGQENESFGLTASKTTPSRLIETVAPGGPAQQAGLRPGDLITPDGPLSPEETHGSPLRKVHLTVQRSGRSRPWTVDLMPARFTKETVLGVRRLSDNSWDYFADPGRKIAQLRITFIDQGTAVELGRVLVRLQTEGLRALILDFRWCAGGFLNESRHLADLFLPSYNVGHLVYPAPPNLLALADLHLGEYYGNALVVYREGGKDVHQRRAPGLFGGFPMVVLVNAETSGGGELVAAVLQDNLRARVAGQRTRGKGNVQSLLDLTAPERLGLVEPVPNTWLKLTQGILTRPSQKTLNRFPESRVTDEWGVLPDPRLEFRVSPELSQRLREWWQWQTLRPGGCAESLPLDDPLTDPQREAVLKMLRRLLK